VIRRGRGGRVADLRAPKGFCRGCHGPVTPPRRTWCSDRCVDKARIKLDPGYARSLVHQRDRGVCATCGFDADRAGRILMRLECGTGVMNRNNQDYMWRRRTIAFLINHWNQPKRRVESYYTVPHLWEADHIVAVAEGGGACELDNYRTLCIPCHREATRRLLSRLAEARRLAKMSLLASPQAEAAVDPVGELAKRDPSTRDVV
jgi:5-methylcytosine-specific restriction enzyme A